MLKNLSSRYVPKKSLIDIERLNEISFQVGAIASASLLKKANKPTHEMTGDFGSMKKSCGQLVRNYTADDLLNKQIVAVTNFAPRRIAGIKSEYLTLGFFDEQNDGQAIVITPHVAVANGVTLWANFKQNLSAPEVSYDRFEQAEIKSCTVIDIVHWKEANCTFCVVDFGEGVKDLAFVPGNLAGDRVSLLNRQIAVVANVTKSSLERVANCVRDTNLIAMSAPLTHHQQSRDVALIVIDKPVRNGLDLF